MPTTTPAPDARGTASRQEMQAAAAVVLLGFALMAVGAAIGGAVGNDLFKALDATSTDEMKAYLTGVNADSAAFIANLSFWIIGVPVIAIGGSLLARLGRSDAWATVARVAFSAGAGAAIVYYALMMGVVAGIAPAHADGQDVIALTRSLGWGASSADWVSTVLVLGVGPFSVAWSGRGVWTPVGLERFSYLVAVTAVVSLGALAANQRGITFLMVPVGMAFLAATGIAALRHAR